MRDRGFDEGCRRIPFHGQRRLEVRKPIIGQGSPRRADGFEIDLRRANLPCEDMAVGSGQPVNPACPPR